MSSANSDVPNEQPGVGRTNQRQSRKTNATLVAQRARRHLELFPYRSEQRQLIADCREAILQLIEEVGTI